MADYADAYDVVIVLLPVYFFFDAASTAACVFCKAALTNSDVNRSFGAETSTVTETLPATQTYCSSRRVSGGPESAVN